MGYRFIISPFAFDVWKRSKAGLLRIKISCLRTVPVLNSHCKLLVAAGCAVWSGALATQCLQTNERWWWTYCTELYWRLWMQATASMSTSLWKTLYHLNQLIFTILINSCQTWATKFFTIPRRDTWDHSLVSLTYLVDEHSALPAPIAWKYIISNFPPSAAELFRLPPHRSGTHYQTQSFRHQHCGRSSTNWILFYFNDPSFISTVIVVSQ